MEGYSPLTEVTHPFSEFFVLFFITQQNEYIPISALLSMEVFGKANNLFDTEEKPEHIYFISFPYVILLFFNIVHLFSLSFSCLFIYIGGIPLPTVPYLPQSLHQGPSSIINYDLLRTGGKQKAQPPDNLSQAIGYRVFQLRSIERVFYFSFSASRPLGVYFVYFRFWCGPNPPNEGHAFFVMT